MRYQARICESAPLSTFSYAYHFSIGGAKAIQPQGLAKPSHTLHLYTSRLCFTSQIGSWGRVAAEVYGRCGHHDARVLRGWNTATHCPCAGGPELPGRESSTLTNLSCPSAVAQPGADKLVWRRGGVCGVDG